MKHLILITNRNRDGAKIWLHQKKEKSKSYSIKTDKPYIFEYCRLGYDPNDHNHPIFVDPSGGPLICVGDVYEGYKVKKIRFGQKGLYLVMKELKNECN